MIGVLLALAACSQSTSQLRTDSLSPVSRVEQIGRSVCGPRDLDDPFVKACFASLDKFPRRERTQLVTQLNQKTDFKTTLIVEYEEWYRWRSVAWDSQNITRTIIFVNSMTYVQQGGPWLKFTREQLEGKFNISYNGSPDSILSPVMSFTVPTIVSVTTQLIGSESLNGLPTQVYESTRAYSNGDIATVKAWIGSDGLIYKETAQGMPSMIFEYDSGIHIEAPDSTTANVIQGRARAN